MRKEVNLGALAVEIMYFLFVAPLLKETFYNQFCGMGMCDLSLLVFYVIPAVPTILNIIEIEQKYEIRKKLGKIINRGS